MDNISPDKKTLLIEQVKDVSFLFSKSKRIVSAIYLVTSLFPETEPIREEIRKTSMSFMSLSFYRTFSPDFKKVKDYLVALLDIAYESGILSLMNRDLIVREIQGLSGSAEIPETAFDVDKALAEKKSNNYSSQEQPKISEKETAVFNISDKKTPHSERPKRVYSDSDLTREKRRRDILAIVKKRHEVTIKDVSNLLTNCSEKTIQRELISMVDNGLLIKRGERRWSTYSLPR